MVLLACNCLNVKISVKGDNLNNNQQTDIAPKNTAEKFFTRSPLPMELETSRITQEHPYLVHRKHVGDWILYQCLVCNVTTHARSIQPSTKFLVSQLLQHDSAVFERLMKSSDFSPAFQIILQNQDSAFTGTVPDPMSRSYESLQSHLNSIQENLDSYLLCEEASMEARIREFEQKERDQFTLLQNHVRMDQKNMVSLLLAAAEMDNSAGLTPDTGKSVVVTGTAAIDNIHQDSSVKKKPTLMTTKVPVSRTRSMPLRSHFEQNDDDMFVLDDELRTESEEPFYNSDDDGKDDTVDEEILYRQAKQNTSIYSSSVPVSVPVWTSGRSPAKLKDEEIVPIDPDEMAASMQALAQSITDDGRYIFGDRPRPRLNTGDFSTK